MGKFQGPILGMKIKKPGGKATALPDESKLKLAGETTVGRKKKQ